MKLYGKKDVLIFTLVPLLLYTFTVFIPIIWSIGLSFFEWNGISDMKFVGFEYYKKMFSGDKIFFTAFKNNIIYLIYAVVFELGVGMILAIILTSLKRLQNIIKILYFTPAVISTVALARIVTLLLSLQPMGLVNYVFGAIGLENLQRSFVTDPHTALATVSISAAYRSFGIYMVIYYAAFISIPEEVVEAARIDGTNPLQTLLYVKLPLMRDTFGVTLVMCSSGALKAFEMPYVMTNGGPGHTTTLVSNYMYSTTFSTMNYGYGSALAVFMILICLCMVLIQKQSVFSKE